MSRTYQSPRGPTRSTGGSPAIEPEEAVSNAAQIERMTAPASDGEARGSRIMDMFSRFNAGFGAGPSWLVPVTGVPWAQPDGFDGVRRLVEEEAPLSDTPGPVLHSDTSVGSSGYSRTQVNGPGVRKDDDGVHAHGLEAAGYLRTQGSKTQATVKLGEMDMALGDSPGFTAGLGSASLQYEGQHTRASAQAQGPSVGMSYNNKDGPAMKLSTGSASAEGTATLSGSRWSASAGGRVEASGPSAKLSLGGFEMSGPDTSVEGGVGLSRCRVPGDPSSAEQVASLTRARGELPNVTVNPDALIHLAQDNPEAMESIRRGLADAVLDEQGTGLGEDFVQRISPEPEATTSASPDAESASGGGFWSFISSFLPSGGSGSSGGAVESAPRDETYSGSPFEDSGPTPSWSSSSETVEQAAPSPSSDTGTEQARREEPEASGPTLGEQIAESVSRYYDHENW